MNKLFVEKTIWLQTYKVKIILRLTFLGKTIQSRKKKIGTSKKRLKSSSNRCANNFIPTQFPCRTLWSIAARAAATAAAPVLCSLCACVCVRARLDLVPKVECYFRRRIHIIFAHFLLIMRRAFFVSPFIFRLSFYLISLRLFIFIYSLKSEMLMLGRYIRLYGEVSLEIVRSLCVRWLLLRNAVDSTL